MTGIERLRELADDEKAYGYLSLSIILSYIADQIERERACDVDAIENVRLIVGGVVDDMERHVLGHEGMEDSPVARWARELREAMGGEEHDTLPEEDAEAAAWVREHGGLEAVKASVHQGAMEHGYFSLTHRAPVLAADGRPLREGETAWNVKTGERYVVGAFAGGCVNVSDGRGGGLQLLPSQLTHERPVADTWGRLEEDAGCTATKYNERRGTIFTTKQQVARDLVRRAKALAGRDAS